MLHARAMGPDFAALPPALQRFHDVGTERRYAGEVTVRHAGPIARALARAGGMPARAGTMPFGFRSLRDGAQEIWERDFDGHLVRSVQWLHAPGVIAERLGGAVFHLRPQAEAGGLRIAIRAARGFGLPLPPGLLHGSGGVEGVTAAGEITFDVRADLPGLGTVIRYSGVLRGPLG